MYRWDYWDDHRERTQPWRHLWRSRSMSVVFPHFYCHFKTKFNLINKKLQINEKCANFFLQHKFNGSQAGKFCVRYLCSSQLLNLDIRSGHFWICILSFFWISLFSHWLDAKFSCFRLAVRFPQTTLFEINA